MSQEQDSMLFCLMLVKDCGQPVVKIVSNNVVEIADVVVGC